MLIRNCSGGIVFKDEKVFILRNEKKEWILPKGVIRNNELAHEVAINRVRTEAGIDAEILTTAGETSYEFYSYTRKQPVCNQITWYIMECDGEVFKINLEENFTDGGFYSIEDALEMITYSQDRALVCLSFEKYKKMNQISFA